MNYVIHTIAHRNQPRSEICSNAKMMITQKCCWRLADDVYENTLGGYNGDTSVVHLKVTVVYMK